MKKLLIALGVIAALTIIVVAAVSRRKTPGDGVYAADVARGNVVTVVTGTGVIQPRTKVNVSSQIYGQILEIAVKEGQTVRKGELLVRIDPERYRSEVERLAANMRVNHIAIEEEQANLRNLEIEQRRARELFKQGILPVSERERADLAVETSRIRLRSLEESVTQAQAALRRAQDDLDKTTIFAPMSGRVTQLNTEVGEQVIVGTTNIPGSVMLVISDMGEVLAEVSVDETEVVKLRPGQKGTVTADAVEKTSYEGVVSEIRNTAKREGEVNVFGVKLLLTNPDDRLRPGMTAKAKIEVSRRERVLRVPIQAVTTRERKKLEDDRRAAGSAPAGSSGTALSARTAGGAAAHPEAKAAASGEPASNAAEAAAEPASAKSSAATAAEPAATRPANDSVRAGPEVRMASAGSGGREPGGRGAKAETAKAEAGRAGSGKPASDTTAASARAGPSKAGAQDPGAENTVARGGARAGEAAAEGKRGDSGTAATPGSETERPGAVGGAGDEREEIEVVYVIDKGVVHAVPVQTGASEESYVEILEGLKEGQTVVTGPYRILKRLKDGDRVVKKDERESTEESEGSSGGGPRARRRTE